MKFLYLTAIILFINGSAEASPIQFESAGKQLNIKVMDGMTGKLLDGKSSGPNKWQTQDGLEISFSPTGKSGKIFSEVVFSVPSDSNAVHRLTIEAACKAENPKYFFDGFKKRVWDGKTVLERNTIMETFPLTVAWNHNSGTALGLSPDSMVSYMNIGIRRNKEEGELFFSTRIVADAKRQQKITFCMLKFKPEFGWLNAVDSYYKEYPSYFKPAPGVDERIYGIGGYFTSTHVTRDLEIHSGRQLNMTWEWTYTPWNRAGYWYINREDWKPGDGYYWWNKYMGNHPCSWEEYHMAETKRFESGNRQAAMFFYVLLKDTWKDLVMRFPESRAKRSSGKLSTYSHNYSRIDNKGKTLLSFAYGSGLADYLENEIREVVENYQVSGFAFDMANWDGNEYCDAQMKYAVGRCFDRDGKIYTANSILPIPFAEYIHTLKKGKKTMGVYMNLALCDQPALPVFYADALMFEGTPEMQTDNFKAIRLMAGQKPMTFWGSIARRHQNTAIKWTLAQQPEIKQDINDGLAQYLLFNCLRYGISPMNWAVAYKDGQFFRPWLSTIIDLKKSGWQVIPAVKWEPDVKLWCGRFGSGINTIFTISNPTRKPIETTVRIFNSYLGTDKYIPKAVTGQKIKPARKGAFTQIQVKLQPKEIMVLRDNSWKPRLPLLLSTESQITGFFTMADAKSAAVSVVAPDAAAKTIYDYVDRYYPYIQAGLTYHKKVFTREVFKLNPAYTKCWRLPLKRALGDGKQIVIGTPEQFPELFAQFSQTEKDMIRKSSNGFLKVFPKQSILWIGGNDSKNIRKASDEYFELMDQSLNTKIKTAK